MSRWRTLLAAAALCLLGTPALAAPASLRFCDRTAPMTAQQQDRVLRFAALVKGELDASGDTVALVSRSGMDLQRFGLRYSHAGITLKAGDTPWSVRQLYYACDEGRPRLYDQGLSGFLFGSDDTTTGYVSIVLLPREQAEALERTARDNARALRLLAATYSANAYPFSLRYQNCNQWVMELLAAAWAPLPDGDTLRGRAQRWLADSGYAPAPVDIGSHWLMAIEPFIPLVHLDDHPEDDRFALKLRISLPTSIEAFVHAQWPQARRIELCHDAKQAVVREGWEAFGRGCAAAPGDRVVALD